MVMVAIEKRHFRLLIPPEINEQAKIKRRCTASPCPDIGTEKSYREYDVHSRLSHSKFFCVQKYQLSPFQRRNQQHGYNNAVVFSRRTRSSDG